MNTTALQNRALPIILIVCWSVSASSAATDPFVGKWKLNPSRSTIADQMTIQAAGDNKYDLTFVGAGQPETVIADGTDQPGLGGTMLSVTVEKPGTWKIVRKKDGQVTIRATWNLSEDGRTLSDAFTQIQPDGSSSTMNMVYERTAGDSGIPGTWETTDVKIGTVYELEIRPYQTDGFSYIAAGAPAKNITFDDKEHVDPTTGAAFFGHRIDERSVEFVTKIKGKVVQTRQLKLSPDGKMLTVVLHLPDQRLPNTIVFDRE